MCNGQSENYLGSTNMPKGPGTLNRAENKCGEDSMDADMVILDQFDAEHQVPQILGDPEC